MMLLRNAPRPRLASPTLLALAVTVLGCGDGGPGFCGPGGDLQLCVDLLAEGEHAYCDALPEFDAATAADEEEVLRLINEHRAAGAHCGEHGAYAATHPLTMEPRLRCAARAHTVDMAEREYFDHYSPEGDGPSERIAATGYTSGTWGENIARRSGAEAVVNAWMASDGHCRNIMNDSFQDIGVGNVDNLWTLKFARPR
jgi:uncharacterized protein YkwD